jgi:ankyrin repeat protein
VKILLDEGVDVNTKFRYGATALSYASDRGHLDVVRLLLERGADANVKDTFYGATPLSWASSPAQARKPAHAEIVGLLLKHGARGQDAALMAAIEAGDEPMTGVILQQGGLPADTLSDALETAEHQKQSAIVAALERAGAKRRPVVTLTEAQLSRCIGTFSNGTTPLTFALEEGKLRGGAPGQTLTLVPRSESTFAVAEVPLVTVVFSFGADKATSVSINRSGTPTVYTRVEGK